MSASSHSEADERKSLGATVPLCQLLCRAGVCNPPYVPALASAAQQIAGMGAACSSKNSSFALRVVPYRGLSQRLFNAA